jgi:hypothetical protein
MNREIEFAEQHAEEHAQWLELCALATAGELSPEERDQLRAHLAGCAKCRQAMAEYRLVAREGMPLAAEEMDAAPGPIDLPHWDAGEAKQRLFAALDSVEPDAPPASVPATPTRVRPMATIAAWAGLAACLVIAVGLGSYQLGRRSVHANLVAPSPLAAKVESLTREKANLDQRLRQENADLAALEKQTADKQDEIALLRDQLRNSQAQANDALAGKAASEQQLQAASADRDSLSGKLHDAQTQLQSVQTELTNLKSQRQQDQLRYASLEVEVNDLTSRLHAAEARVTDDTQYLASDRDIRELMGARQLYIADVVDVDQNGDRRKPFGRVFYTKGRSLVFYAFDLDQQPGLKQTSIFQAWAREGSDKGQPVSLGIFYVDSEANRRWALKASDPKTLAQINSVFVTVEPNGGSQKPTGKPLLYAYLRTESPNHP